MEKFLKQQVSSDVPGTYVPPIYQLPGKSVSEVRLIHDMDVLVMISCSLVVKYFYPLGKQIVMSLSCWLPLIHPQNGLESQPLAYLYFLTVLEHLVSVHSDLSNLLTITMEVGK